MSNLLLSASTLLLLSTAFTAAAPAPDPAQFVWRSRVLLVFALDGNDPALIRQQQIVTDAQAGVTERDLVLLADTGADPALRRRYGVGGGQFEALLLGKDGGVKLRSAQPFTAETLFRTIDAMPMRRDEARRAASPAITPAGR